MEVGASDYVDSPLGYLVANDKLDACTDASIRIEQLEHLVVFPLYILFQLFSPDGQVTEQCLYHNRRALLCGHDRCAPQLARLLELELRAPWSV